MEPKQAQDMLKAAAGLSGPYQQPKPMDSRSATPQGMKTPVGGKSPMGFPSKPTSPATQSTGNLGVGGAGMSSKPNASQSLQPTGRPQRPSAPIQSAKPPTPMAPSGTPTPSASNPMYGKYQAAMGRGDNRMAEYYKAKMGGQGSLDQFMSGVADTADYAAQQSGANGPRAGSSSGARQARMTAAAQPAPTPAAPAAPQHAKGWGPDSAIAKSRAKAQSLAQNQGATGTTQPTAAAPRSAAPPTPAAPAKLPGVPQVDPALAAAEGMKPPELDMDPQPDPSMLAGKPLPGVPKSPAPLAGLDESINQGMRDIMGGEQLVQDNPVPKPAPGIPQADPGLAAASGMSEPQLDMNPKGSTIPAIRQDRQQAALGAPTQQTPRAPGTPTPSKAPVGVPQDTHNSIQAGMASLMQPGSPQGPQAASASPTHQATGPGAPAGMPSPQADPLSAGTQMMARAQPQPQQPHPPGEFDESQRQPTGPAPNNMAGPPVPSLAERMGVLQDEWDNSNQYAMSRGMDSIWDASQPKQDPGGSMLPGGAKPTDPVPGQPGLAQGDAAGQFAGTPDQTALQNGAEQIGLSPQGLQAPGGHGNSTAGPASSPPTALDPLKPTGPADASSLAPPADLQGRMQGAHSLMGV